MADSPGVTQYTLREIQPSDRAVVDKLLVEAWGAAQVYAVAYGGMVDAGALPGWLAEQDGEVAGLLTYRITGTIADIITINAFRSGGVGAALVDRLAAAAPALGATRIRVVTTNDNTRALRFYQRCGFRLTVLRPDAMTEARRHKPRIPEVGNDGIPIRDELELELPV